MNALKTYIVKKAASVSDWMDGKAYIERNIGTKAKHDVVIEKNITLTPSEFAYFCDNFLEDMDFIKANRDLMREDENGVWYCIKLTARESKISVLVESEGYDYARYTAVISK